LETWDDEKVEKASVHFPGLNLGVIALVSLAAVASSILFIESRLASQVKAIQFKVIQVTKEANRLGVRSDGSGSEATLKPASLDSAKRQNDKFVRLLATTFSETDATLSLSSVRLEFADGDVIARGGGSAANIPRGTMFAQRLTQKLAGYTVVINSMERKPELGPQAVTLQFEMSPSGQKK
jgi:hypothetical protein